MRRLLTTVILALALVPATMTASGQENGKKDWREIWKAEKIAYLTDAMDLTSSEAEAFWPVYNKAEKEKFLSYKAVMNAYKDLEDGISSGKSDTEVARLLDAYFKAQQKSNGIDSAYAKEYRKILSEKKVAKLYIGEEKFRRNQIHRLNRGGKGGEKK